ncbi:glycosyltransferase family 2 protein [Sphingorhabdus sp.]|uniref:glycosyltransferase family 2 protein n=1 Tax=Sphingorhabdus sp. TaxID=1902408 RepID=UPI00391CF808
MVRIPRVSMIVPVFNGAKYLGAALDSILTQDFGDFELICVDDGSNDTTPQILADYARRDSRIVHLSNESNLGLPATLNCGFAHARGQYHSWTSHDNVLRPEMLSTLVQVLDADAAIGVAYAGYSVINSDGQILRYQPPRPAEDRWFGNPVGAAFLYRREVTEKLRGYDQNLFGVEDYDFWLRAARNFLLQPIDRDLYLYRRHNDSLTNQRSRQIKDLVAMIIERELEDVSDVALRSKALLNLVLADHSQFRSTLVSKAFAASPAAALVKLPALCYHFARIAAAPLRA